MMSALGHKRTWRRSMVMSAIPPERTWIRARSMAALCHKATFAPAANCSLFDHLVGAGQHGRRHSKPKGLGGLQVDDELECGWLLYWQICRLLAL